ncbi:WD40 repeat domain-containing protein [Candidatus Dependentiae bacterium]|jgi:WD40 repeat protein|nr:WD40 repeat domain-containing protein [Candidatus Dependentiae bacterium]
MKLHALFFSLIVATFMSSTHAMNNNLFEQGTCQRVEHLLNIFNPTINVFRTCSENLKENPGLENFQTNFAVINTAYKTLCEKIQDQSLLFEFMELKETSQIKEKIETIKNYFDIFHQVISANTPKYSLLEHAGSQQENLKHIMNVFIKNKCHCHALAQGNMETLEAFFERKQEAFDWVEITVEPHTADDEKLAQELQQKLNLESNLELMYEREAQERSVLNGHLRNENLVDEQAIEMVECFSNEEVLPECQSTQQRGASIFSGVTNDTQFIAEFKKIIYGMDITKKLDQELFNKLAAHAPTNFSMVMNREIGRATPYNLMQHNFCMPSYAHHFPECMMNGNGEVEALQTISLGNSRDSIFFIKQLDDTRIACCLSDGTRVVWDLNTSSYVSIQKKINGSQIHLKQLNDGSFALFSDSQPIKVLDLDSNIVIANLYGHNSWINCIKQLDNGYLASGGMDTSVKIWDLNKKECIATFKHSNIVNCIKQLNSGHIASCSDDKTIKIWDLNTKECLFTFNGHEGIVYFIKQLRDGNLVSCSSDGKMMVWNLKTKKLIAQLSHNMTEIHCIKELHDGHVAVVCNHRIVIWDLKKGKSVKAISLNKEGCFCYVTQLLDGRLVAGLKNGNIKIFNFYDDLLLEQIALIVNLEQYFQKSKVVVLGEGWWDVFETLPDYFWQRFEQFVS